MPETPNNDIRAEQTEGAQRQSVADLPPVGRALIDLVQAAAALSISERLLAELVAEGEVPHVRIRRRLLFRPEALREWAAAREKGGAA